MVDRKPRLTRLAAILTQLQSKSVVTAREIADRHQVSIRTVYRDIRALEQSGIPILTQEGKGYAIMEGYKLPPIMFTEEEANALLTAGHLIQKNKDASLVENYERAITKIKATLRHKQKDYAELLNSRVQVRNNYHSERTSSYLIQIQSTIAKFQLVDIVYHSLNNVSSQRIIEPFALYTTQDNWVLVAHCRNKQAFRAFRLDRIQRLQVLSEHFTPHDLTLEQYLEQCRTQWSSTPDTQLSQPLSSFAMNLNQTFMQTVSIKPFMVIGISVRTTNEDGQGVKDIGALWERFRNEDMATHIPNRSENTIFSMYTDYEGDHTQAYTAFLGCKVSSLDNVPEGMEGRSFDGGKYVKMSARGNLMDGLIAQQWAAIWAMDLERAFSVDFEIFSEKAHNPLDAEVDFMIAVN